MADNKEKADKVQTLPKTGSSEIWNYSSEKVQEVAPTGQYSITPHLWEDERLHIEQAVESLPEDGQISEWGSGGSTTMFVELLKPKQSLISVEHNPTWFSKVGSAIANHPNCKRVNYIFADVRVKIQKGNHGYIIDHNYWGYGDPPEENPIFLQHYIHPKLKNKDLDIFNSDLYLVDGIARAAVLASILIKSKKRDALVYVHDYVGREDWYEWAVSAYAKREIVGHTMCKLTF